MNHGMNKLFSALPTARYSIYQIQTLRSLNDDATFGIDESSSEIGLERVERLLGPAQPAVANSGISSPAISELNPGAVPEYRVIGQ